MPSTDAAAIERAFRESSGRAVATLVRVFGDIDLAEDAVQEAFAVAAERWPAAGVPPNPGGWIVTTARNKALDRLRRESSRFSREAQAAQLHADAESPEVGPVHDDRLRLIFTCCHPSLAAEAQLALTLRLIAGLQTPEIARAFLVQAEDPRRGHPLPGSARRGAARPAPPGAGGHLPRLQRGIHGLGR